MSSPPTDHIVEWEIDTKGISLPTIKWQNPHTPRAGILVIKLIEAINLFKNNMFGKQDIFVEIKVGEDKRKSPVVKGGGTAPKFDQTMQFNLNGSEQKLTIYVFTDSTLSKDLVGKCKVPLELLLPLTQTHAFSSPNSTALPLSSPASPDGTSVPPEGEHIAWFKLGRDNRQKTYAGQILLRIIYSSDSNRRLSLVQPMTASKGSRPREGSVIADLRKGKKRGQLRIFGCPLETVVAISGKEIPKVCYLCIEYLRKNGLTAEGLFRQAGNHETVKRLRASLDLNVDVEFDNPYDCADVFKTYLRELPEPVVPFSHYRHFLDAVANKDVVKRSEHFRVLIASLPSAHRDLLEAIITFLKQVAGLSGKNRMTSKNLAIVFAPTLMRSDPPVLEDAQDLPIVIETLIDQADSIFKRAVVTTTGSGLGSGSGSVKQRKPSVTEQMSAKKTTEELAQEVVRLKEDLQIHKDLVDTLRAQLDQTRLSAQEWRGKYEYEVDENNDPTDDELVLAEFQGDRLVYDDVTSTSTGTSSTTTTSSSVPPAAHHVYTPIRNPELKSAAQKK